MGAWVVASQWRQGVTVCLKIGERKREEFTLFFCLTPRVNILFSALFSGFKIPVLFHLNSLKHTLHIVSVAIISFIRSLKQHTTLFLFSARRVTCFSLIYTSKYVCKSLLLIISLTQAHNGLVHSTCLCL